MPDNPEFKLVSTERFKAIDRLRRQARLPVGRRREPMRWKAADWSRRRGRRPPAPDLHLLPPGAGGGCAALTLREICDLTTEETPGLLATPWHHTARVRAKGQIWQIPYQVPSWRSCFDAWTVCCRVVT